MSDRNGLYSSQQLILISRLPRRISKHHLIEDDSQWPNIAFSRVLTALQDLRSHVDGASHTRLEHLRAEVIDVFRKSEVADFISTFIDENICWLEVSVNDLFSNEFAKSIQYLAHNFEYVLFFELLSLHEFLQISIFAELSDDVETVLWTQYILELDDIRMIKSLEQIDLRKYSVLQILIIGESGEIDLFNGYFFLAFPFNTLVDLAIDALS